MCGYRLMVAVSLTALLPACVAGEAITCPDSFRVEQSLVQTVEGWTASQDSLAPKVASVTLFDGPSAEGASLVPDEESLPDAQGRYETVWKLGRNSTRGYWITCGYSSTTIVLSKKLPQSSTCRVTYDRKITVAGLPSIASIECK